MFAPIDFPQARATLPFKINDSGEIVGYFFDSSGRQHGFSYVQGQWTRIDYPGARATVSLGINSAGLIVGAFLDATQPIVHGFTVFNGRFVKVDTPFALNAEVGGINDLGQYAGSTWNDRVNGPGLGFVGCNNQFSLITMPGAQFTEPQTTNNNGMIAGNFDNGDGYSSGFVRLFGYLHEVNVNGDVTYVYGNNDLNEIAGDAYDFNTQRWVGYIGDLPITNSK
jgi:probable HAF family extracellular repeat protein